jgi:hypothetical protein
MLLATLFTLAAQAQGESPPAKSDPIPVLYRLTYWEVSEKTLASLAGKAKVGANQLEGRRLQSAEVLAISGEETMVSLVRKSPLVYYDPRASQFQVQFVDSGVKLDAFCKALSSQSFEVDVRQELSRIGNRRPADSRDQATVYPETEVFTLESTLSDVKFGDLIVLGSTSGTLGKAHVKALDPAPKAPYLVATLELEAP